MKHKKLLSSFFFSFFFLASLFVKAQNSQEVIPCYTTENLEELIKKDPSIVQKKLDFDAVMQKIAKDYKAENNAITSKSVPRIIPVVFHVIHGGGAENISKAQIEDQIRILNEDFRRLNADAANTPAPFAAVAADCNIEFKLAKKDPNGNCTDGIVRVLSPLTNGPVNRDDVKAVSYWPSNKYLNYWVVKNIDNGGSSGTILGYAQFPGWGSAYTDGIVVRADYTGSIETGSQNYMGRTATHEVGHWLGLRHIWGDATCGNDNVSDTPTHRTNNGGCATFPKNTNLCSGVNSDGEMFMNYMDYSSGSCANMFSAGQKAVMDYVLVNNRANLISASNLTATGVNDPDILCKAEFMADKTVICAGDSIAFTDLSFSGQTTWTWNFTGGMPTSSGVQKPTTTYLTPGTYTVQLTVGDGSSTKSTTKTNYITVLPSTGRTMPVAEGFEAISSLPNNDWVVSNNGGSINWGVTSTAATSGSKSLKLNNVNNIIGQQTEFTSSTIDLSALPGVNVSFKVAFAQKNTSNNDVLKVFVSNNCGQTWAQRWGKGSSLLATAPVQSSAFTPSASQWVEYTITNISSTYLVEKFRIKFQFTNGGGNNVYIDDINLFDPATIGVAENLSTGLDLAIFPNPVEDNTIITFHLKEQQDVVITLTDVLGRTTEIINNGSLNVGEHRFNVNNKELSLRKGVYIIKVVAGGRFYTTKMVVK